MSQLDSNQMKAHLEQMTSGLNGMVALLESSVNDSLKAMDAKQAKEFSKAMESAGVGKQVENLKKEVGNLKKGFDIM